MNSSTSKYLKSITTDRQTYNKLKRIWQTLSHNEKLEFKIAVLNNGLQKLIDKKRSNL